MPIRILSNGLITIGTSFFMVIGSGHYDFQRNIQTDLVTTQVTTTQTTTTTTVATIPNVMTTTPSQATCDAFALTATPISVSCIKLKWNGDENTDYTVMVTQVQNDEYIDNVYFVFKSNTLCYVTGLRENSEYIFEISDETGTILATTRQRTEAVEVIQEYESIDGWTGCFAYEKASGLTQEPSYSAIQGAISDPITDTGIMRDEYGDYCCAMGTFFGYCGDRFLITLENGVQFTTKICDSKGDRVYHPFGDNGKCIVEFIYADGYLPNCVAVTGNYGSFNWFGLNFGNIQKIQKINYGETVEY